MALLNYRKVKAAYVYNIHNICGRNIISIVDLKSGGCSVTNDIDNIIREIGIYARINVSAYMIIYKDTEDIWDAYDYAKSAFISLNATHIHDAIKKYIKLQLNTDLCVK